MPINDPILNNQFEPNYRDYPQRTVPITLEFARPVLESECHVMRYFQVPDDRVALAETVGQYIQATVSIAPGSFVVGCQQKDSDGIGFLVQLTDQATGHKLFSQPMPTQFLFRDQTYFLPCPLPVLAPGILLVEIWAQQVGECSLVLAVAEYDAEWAKMRGCINGN